MRQGEDGLHSLAQLVHDRRIAKGGFLAARNGQREEPSGELRKTRQHVAGPGPLLREGRSVTDVWFDVGFNSLGTFSRTFSAIVGVSPAVYRRRGPDAAVPTCFAMAWVRPSSFGEARKRRA